MLYICIYHNEILVISAVHFFMFVCLHQGCGRSDPDLGKTHSDPQPWTLHYVHMTFCLKIKRIVESSSRYFSIFDVLQLLVSTRPAIETRLKNLKIKCHNLSRFMIIIISV